MLRSGPFIGGGVTQVVSRPERNERMYGIKVL
jgi:hypothetical protein